MRVVMTKHLHNSKVAQHAETCNDRHNLPVHKVLPSVCENIMRPSDRFNDQPKRQHPNQHHTEERAQHLRPPVPIGQRMRRGKIRDRQRKDRDKKPSDIREKMRGIRHDRKAPCQDAADHFDRHEQEAQPGHDQQLRRCPLYLLLAIESAQSARLQDAMCLTSTHLCTVCALAEDGESSISASPMLALNRGSSFGAAVIAP